MIINDTPWQVAEVTGWDMRQQQAFIVIIKQSYEYDLPGEVAPLAASEAVCRADEFNGPASASSLRVAAETMPYKQGFELYGQLTAFAPRGRQTTCIEVRLSLSLGKQPPFFDKCLRVNGQRRWRPPPFGAPFFTRASEPLPLLSLPICYEHAFGGSAASRTRHDWRGNPAGRGFAIKPRHARGVTLPAIELYADPLQRPGQRIAVAGFGPLPAFWHPRLERQPRPDPQAILQGGYPFKEPVDARAYNVAPDDQQLEMTLQDGLCLGLQGISPQQTAAHTTCLPLPYQPPNVERWGPLGWERRTPCCDTLVLDTEQQRFHLIWRLSEPVDEPVDESGVEPLWRVSESP